MGGSFGISAVGCLSLLNSPGGQWRQGQRSALFVCVCVVEVTGELGFRGTVTW